MQPDKFPNSLFIIILLFSLCSCKNSQPKFQEPRRNCPTVNLPSDAIIREQLQLLSDTDLHTAKLKYETLIKEIESKNLHQQRRVGLKIDTSDYEYNLVSDKFRETGSNNSDSVYAVPLDCYKVIKLKSSYLIINYWGGFLNFLLYEPNSNDSLIIQTIGVLDWFIGSNEVKTGDASYFTFSFRGSGMNYEYQMLCILAYSNYSGSYKLTAEILNEKTYGTNGDCDSVSITTPLINYSAKTLTLKATNGNENKLELLEK